MNAQAFRWSRLALLGLIAVCSCARPPTVPPEFVGVWEADPATRYHGASLEITATDIVFRKRDGYENRNRILSIAEAKGAGNELAYDIRYTNPSGGKQLLAVAFVPRMGVEALRFRNQPNLLWLKTSPER